MNKNISQSFKIVALASVLSVGISYVSAWTAPTVTPPGGNVAAPLNTGDNVQYKTGTLVLNDNSTNPFINGLIVRYGNVGIGTPAPSNLLSVEKNQNDDTTLSVENLTTGSHSSSRILLDSANAGGIVQFFDSAYTFASRSHYANRFDVRADSRSNGLTLTASAPTGDIRFFTGSDTPSNERARIKSDGKIGIGTVEPTEKLDVAGNIKASGSVCNGSGQCIGGAGGGVVTSGGIAQLWKAVAGQTISCTVPNGDTYYAYVDANGVYYVRVTHVGGGLPPDTGYVHTSRVTNGYGNSATVSLAGLMGDGKDFYDNVGRCSVPWS